jgi:hypothetical protein
MPPDMTQILSIDNIEEIINKITNIGDLSNFFQVLVCADVYDITDLCLIFNRRKNQIIYKFYGNSFVSRLINNIHNRYVKMDIILLENGSDPNYPCVIA